MPSERLAQLKTQLNVLRAHLLPDPFEETGLYEDQERVATSALGYRVLSHAEVESYFEDRALEVVHRARIAWDQSRYVSRVALCLIAFSGREMALPPPSLQAPSDNKRKAWPALLDISEKFGPVISNFNNYVRNENHGIKEKNLMSLLLPIGIDPSKLDPIFLAEIESFGSIRGFTAHSSNGTSVRKAVDPEQELKRIETLIPGIDTIDELIDQLIAEIPLAST